MTRCLIALALVTVFVLPSTHAGRRKKNLKKKEEVAPFEEWADKGEVTHIFSNKHYKKLKKSTKNGIIVMFYAPWCGHCKKMKPEYARASVKSKELDLIDFGAVDCTQKSNKGICSQADVTSFPTLKFFTGIKGRGEDFDGARDMNGILKFSYEKTDQDVPEWLTTAIEVAKEKAEEAKRVQEEADAKWKSGSDVVHLTGSDFKSFRAKTAKMMTMFYAPWCGHCKAMKPAYMDAAAKISTSSEFAFTAVDCTDAANKDLCEEYGVKGYPTIKNFASASSGADDYTGPRDLDGLVAHATA